MSKLRWAKLWWSDWENDPALRQCSLAAQGLWMRLLCLAAQSRIYGVVLVAGRPPTAGEIARIVGDHHTRVAALIRELERNNVFERVPVQPSDKPETEPGQTPDKPETTAIQSRRMRADFDTHKRARLDGLNGGNPALKPPTPHKPNGGGISQPLSQPLTGGLKLEEEAEVNLHNHKNKKPPVRPPTGGARTQGEKIGGRKKERELKCGFVGSVQRIIAERKDRTPEIVPIPLNRIRANE